MQSAGGRSAHQPSFVIGGQRKTLKRLYAFLLLVVSFSPSGTFAQSGTLPSELNQNSTVQDILDYLNKTLFPSARLGVGSSLPGDHESWDAETGYYSNIRSLIFSEGFKLASDSNDCHIMLRNDDVKVYEVDGKKVTPIDLTKITKSQPPHAAEFSVWLETVSFDKGKRPFLHTKYPGNEQLLGSWRTEFQSRGFFGRTIFGVRFPSIKAEVGNEYMMANTVSFTFDDKQTSERFNAAFRRLIKLCQPRSAK
jgi:hypothetical protein